MEEFRLTAKDKQDARMALLRYYSSECIAHGAYLAALAVAFLGLVEATPHILEFATDVAFPTLSEKLVSSAILSLIVSVFVVLFVYVLGRTIFWGYLRAAILNVKPKGGSGVKSELGRTTVTFLEQLHEACLDYVGRRHGMWARFYGLGAGYLALMWFDLFVLFLIISITMLYVF